MMNAAQALWKIFSATSVILPIGWVDAVLRQQHVQLVVPPLGLDALPSLVVQHPSDIFEFRLRSLALFAS